MEIKLIARVIGAEEQTKTREAFWQKLKGIHEGDEGRISEYERKIYVDFPRELKSRIESFLSKEWGLRPTRSIFALPSPDAAAASIPHVFRRFRRHSVLGKDFFISVKSLRYGSLEILLNFLAGDDFPLRARDIIQLLELYAPQVLSDVLESAPLAVTIGQATGSLRGDGGIAAEESDHSASLRRAFYLANFSLLVPVALTLAVCYVAFNAMLAQINAAGEERRILMRDLAAQAANVDADRRRLVKDALDLVEASRTSAAELDRLIIELKRELSERSNRQGAIPDTVNKGTQPTGRPVLVTRNFTIFGTGPTIDFGELAKGIIDESVKLGPKQVRDVIQAVGDGIDVAKKTVDLASALTDLYWKIWPKKIIDPLAPPIPPPVCKEASASPPPQSLTEGTLLDRQVKFEYNSAELDRETLNELKSVAEKVRTSQTTVLVEGHADGAGAAPYNERLSQRRADAVKKFLVDNGVPASQVHTYGYGKGYLWLPYVPADAANRRVRVIECTIAGENRCKPAGQERVRRISKRNLGERSGVGAFDPHPASPV